MDDPENAGITSDDDQARNNERNHEQSGFAAAAVRVAQNRARTQLAVVAKGAPHLEQCRQLHAVRQQPTEQDHGGDPMSLVDACVRAVMCDHDVAVCSNLIRVSVGVAETEGAVLYHLPINRDHGNAQQRNANVTVLHKRNEPA